MSPPVTQFMFTAVTVFVLQVFHKIITTGHQRLQPLFDCLLTIVVNGELLWCHLSVLFAAILEFKTAH